ncbi:response regulator [Paracoccaceae bacterium Fryx2]|nr:response regulator [Paracoccaceae bacterium Fryx2]
MHTSKAAAIRAALPYLRRYGRALTGSQDSGDRYAAATLEAILHDEQALDADVSPKVALFRAFHLVWQSVGAPLGDPDNRLSASAQSHMMHLTPQSREALLLHVIEGFSPDDIAAIIDRTTDDVGLLIAAALREMEDSVEGRVMVIEDDAIIAMDIVDIVKGIGHRVTGTARTRDEAVKLAMRDRPDLILADIHLADSSSGIDAVNDILARFPGIPVIFITAFPERFLSGERPEPAFLITKPFTEDQVCSAVSQAMFFASTESLVG